MNNASFDINRGSNKYAVMMRLNRNYKGFSKNQIVEVVPSTGWDVFRDIKTEMNIPDQYLISTNIENDPEAYL